VFIYSKITNIPKTTTRPFRTRSGHLVGRVGFGVTYPADQQSGHDPDIFNLLFNHSRILSRCCLPATCSIFHKAARPSSRTRSGQNPAYYTLHSSDFTLQSQAQDDAHYEKLILDYLGKFKTATRSEINKLLLDKLSDALDEDQKASKVHNLLTRLRMRGEIVNQGSRGHPRWALLKAENSTKERARLTKKPRSQDA